MNERQKRLIEVYDHLRRFYGIHTKTGFAEALHYGRTSMSAAMNGDENYLTDNLFKNICDAYPDVFNIEYLLTGKGCLLTTREEVTNDELLKMVNPSIIDQSSLVNAALAAKDQTITQLELRLSDKDKTITQMENRIAEKDKYIESLEKRVAELEAAAVFIRENDFAEKWPFVRGVADERRKILDPKI